jgi:hypothetical protein
MATLEIWETVRASSGLPVIRLDDRVVAQDVDFTAGATQSAAFGEATSIIALRSDVNCAIAIGANPTATTADYPLTANTLTWVEVAPGAKLSVIAT